MILAKQVKVLQPLKETLRAHGIDEGTTASCSHLNTALAGVAMAMLAAIVAV